MRAILDTNVIISALLSREGTPAAVLREWLQGAFDLIVSPTLLSELDRALSYPKEPPVRSADPADDYLIALAAANDAILVSGDNHLLRLADRIPVLSPRDFVASLEEQA